MSLISEIDFRGKKALIRVDFNVPLNSVFEITDNTRIKAALPSIKYILENNGAVILMSHLGRPKGVDPDFSLSHIISELSSLLGKDVQFDSMNSEEETRHKCHQLNPGEVLLLENLRFDPREKSGDDAFAKFLASLADVYVNDAFGTAHRAHASTAIVAKYAKEKCFGLLMESEIKALDNVLYYAKKDVTAIIGGAKVSSKIGVITKLLERVDHLIIGGGMAYSFLKAQGGEIGNSLIEEDKLDLAIEVLEKAKLNDVAIYLPEDSVIANEFSNDAEYKTVNSQQIPGGWMGLDIGEKAISKFKDIIEQSSTVLWNGPMGVFEFDNFSHGTIEIAKALAEATTKGTYTLVGGGDSVAALKKYNLSDKVSYVSTGGGAMLEYMEGLELPGIASIKS